MRRVGVDAATLGECLLYGFVADTLEVETLCATAYCLEQLLGFLADEDEHSLLRWLLEELEYLVSRGDIHALGQPHHAHLVSALRRFYAQAAREAVALGSGDDGLLVLCAHGIHPLLYAEVGTIAEQLAPLLGVVVAHGLMVGTHRGLLYRGEAEVEVGVLPLAQQRTVAQQTRGERKGKGFLAAAHRTAEQHGVGHSVLLYEFDERLFRLVLTYYFFKCHLRYCEF